MFRETRRKPPGCSSHSFPVWMLCLTLACAIHPGASGASEAPEMNVGGNDRDRNLVLPVARGIPFEPDSLFSDKAPISPDPLDESVLRIVAEALRWKGVPYLYGGASMSGTDCSGYVGAVLAKATGKGSIFPRSSSDFAFFGVKASVPMSPGDILLFARGGEIYHVGIALSSSTFIHSASEGERQGVIVSSLDDGNWRSRLVGIRRIASIR